MGDSDSLCECGRSAWRPGNLGESDRGVRSRNTNQAKFVLLVLMQVVCMIRTYALHWHVDRVFWGRPNNPVTLLGAASRSPRARPVDFREQRGIYALYADYDLIYLGQT